MNVATPRPPLRERKKQRTRDALIDTALDLFTRHGFAEATLDELCDEVEVSKRTFFRYFTSKEDVAMAPLHDFWRAFLDDLRAREPGGGPLLAYLREVLLGTVARMPAQTWTGRALLTARLAARTSSMDAHGLRFCDQTTSAALEILRPRLDLDRPDDPRPRLAADILLAAFRHALAGWAGSTAQPGKAALAARIGDAIDAIPGALTLTTTARA